MTRSVSNSLAAALVAVPMSLTGVSSNSPFVAPAVAQTAAANAGVETAISQGRRVLVVELYGTTLYVFNDAHNVGGPVVKAIQELGFESVLPEGASVGGSGAASLPMETIQKTQADHVLFLNFSSEADLVSETVAALNKIAEGRVRRMDVTTSEALSDGWRVSAVQPRVAEAFGAD